jgi:hypothetical protein
MLNELRPIWRFCLSALAVWRLTHLLASEDGPWDVIVRVRARLGQSILGRLMDCFYCLSLWISLPLAVILSDGWSGLLVYWLALSGAACLLEQSTSKQTAPTIEILEGVPPCAVVRSEAQSNRAAI